MKVVWNYYTKEFINLLYKYEGSWLLLFNKRSKASSNMVRHLLYLTVMFSLFESFCPVLFKFIDFVICSHQSYWLRQTSSLTFWESKTQTSMVNARSCSHSESLRVLVEDSPISFARSPKSTLTREQVNWPSKKLKRSTISSPSQLVSESSSDSKFLKY